MVKYKGDAVVLILIFVGAIVAVTFLAQIGTDATAITSTYSYQNESYTLPQPNATITLVGRTLIGTLIAWNGTQEIGQGNYTVYTTSSSDLVLRTLDVASASNVNGSPVNVSYSFEPDGYVDNSSGRTLTLLIVVFGALGIAVFVIAYLWGKASLGKLARET